MIPGTCGCLKLGGYLHPTWTERLNTWKGGKYYRVHILERSVCYVFGTHVAQQERYLTQSVLIYISTHSCRCKVHSGDINGKQEKMDKISTMCRTHSNSFLYCDVYCIIDHPKQEDAKKPRSERGSSALRLKKDVVRFDPPDLANCIKDQPDP